MPCKQPRSDAPDAAVRAATVRQRKLSSGLDFCQLKAKVDHMQPRMPVARAILLIIFMGALAAIGAQDDANLSFWGMVSAPVSFVLLMILLVSQEGPSFLAKLKKWLGPRSP